MTTRLHAARRVAITVAALLVVALAPTGLSSATAESSGAFDRLGHGYLTLDTNLRSPSHVSAWSIDEYLAAHTSLPPLGHEFKAAETKYNVNALYLLAHAMHETGFGTSFISQRFHNLFGWNAADADPVGLATRFRSYGASIDFVTDQIATMYLSDGGRWWGGATTLRAMHGYASDPDWAKSIVGLANSIVLPTLANRRIRFAAPVIDGQLSTGQPAEVAVDAARGSLPNGLRAVYRFVPVAVVEAGAATGPMPKLDPPFRFADGKSVGGRLELTVDAPAWPGRYRLELELRDSDGSRLTEYGVPSIPDVAARVFGSDAVTYTLTQTSSGVGVTVTNVGRRVIPAAGDSITAEDATAAPPPTALSAWLIGADGAATLIATVPLDQDLETGQAWATDLPAALLNGAAHGVLLVRLQVGGASGRLGGSPPGVFVLAAHSDPAAPSTTRAAPGSPAIGPDPSNDANPQAAAPSGLLTATPPPVAPADAESPTILITAVTPVDPVLLLPPARKAASGRSGSASDKAAPSAKDPTTVDVDYAESFDPATGVATVHLTNTGAVTITAGPAPVTSLTTLATTSVQATLLVTAVPAWGPATDPIVLRILLPADLPPGASIDVPVALAPSQLGPSTYLVAARVDLVTAASAATSAASGPSGPGPTLAAPALPALFWLRTTGPATTSSSDDGAIGAVPAPSPGATVGATASPSPTPTPTPTPSPSPTPTPSPTPRPSPTPTPTPRPDPTPTPTPAPTPTPKPAKPAATPAPTATTTTPTAGHATASRMALLRPVAGRPGIYAYIVRPGDVFESIAHWFGVSVDSMRRLNPRVNPRAIRPGLVLLMPTPTR